MAYFTQYHDDGVTEISVANPLLFGTLNRDTEEVSAWKRAIIKTDAGLVSSGNSTVTVVDVTGADSSDLFQLAAFTAGDTTGPAATPAAYGADLTIASVINATTGVSYWVRRKAGPAESPAVDGSAVIRTYGTAIPAA